MVKKAVSKAAASEGPRRNPLGYVKGLNDARTTLAGFFNILLGAPIEFRNHLNHVSLLRFCQFGIDRNRHHLFGCLF